MPGEGEVQNTWGRCLLARWDQQDTGSTNVPTADQPDVLHEVSPIESLFCQSWLRIMLWPLRCLPVQFWVHW